MFDKLIFLLSMPRSGSTWLQRILASNSEISTTAESWLLVPLFEGVMKERVLAEYNQTLANMAIGEFFEQSRISRDGYHKKLAAIAGQTLLDSRASQEEYYLEKTPRNHLFCDRLQSSFPGAKFIFLWRDPVDIAVSIARTWGGRWDTLFRAEIDFYRGLPNLVSTSRALGSSALNVSYEDLLANQSDVMGRIYSYLGLTSGEMEEGNAGAEKIVGTMGDKVFSARTGRNQISRGERRRIRRILDDVPDEVYDYGGYSKDQSLQKLDKTKVRFFEIRDLLSLPISLAYRHQLGPEMKRLRGDTVTFPSYGVE